MYVTRLNFSTENWQKPAGIAGDLEGGKSYNKENRFGHEDWLFRNEWIIDGYRYGFIQGVNRSRKKLLRKGKAFDVVLFTIDDRRRRRYVATIRDAECLTDDAARAALKTYKKNGWYDTMLKEVKDVDGALSKLDGNKPAHAILNVRFRLDNVVAFPENTFAEKDDPVMELKHYQLADVDNLFKPKVKSKSARKASAPAGSTELPKISPFWKETKKRKAQYTPEHALMQERLMQELWKEYPRRAVRREANRVDVVVDTKTERILYEIKAVLGPRMAIRLALGQLLEYAYYGPENDGHALRLVIVGRQVLGKDDEAYLELLKQRFQLPIEYRQVPV